MGWGLLRQKSQLISNQYLQGTLTLRCLPHPSEKDLDFLKEFWMSCLFLRLWFLQWTASGVSHLTSMSHACSQKWMPWGILVPPSPSLEYFFSPPLLHSQAKSRLKSGVGWPAKIYENWKAFQCFSPHVMLISSSKGSWLNFLFRNRRIFWIETFVIYKLGRLSALPVQQASRWGGGALQYIWVGCSTTMYDFGWCTLCTCEDFLYRIHQ